MGKPLLTLCVLRIRELMLDYEVDIEALPDYLQQKILDDGKSCMICDQPGCGDLCNECLYYMEDFSEYREDELDESDPDGYQDDSPYDSYMDGDEDTVTYHCKYLREQREIEKLLD
jgi:hypothetical protein